jgi:hypothetical protein
MCLYEEKKMPNNTTIETPFEGDSESQEIHSQPLPSSELPDLDRDIIHVNKVLQTLRQALELKELGGLTEADYQELKKLLLTQNGVKLTSISAKTTTPAITEQTVRQTTIGLYAGEIHELIVQQIEENYRYAQGNTRECMRSLVMKLLDLQALYPQDKLYLYNLIDVVCHGSNITLEDGLRQIDAIDEAVRNNISTSDVAKVTTGIVHRSAKHAVASLESQKIKEPETAGMSLWNAVEEDFKGCLSGGVTMATIAAVPGFSLASLGFVAAASVPITWVPVVGALIGAGVTSGWKYARVRFGQNQTK